MDTDASLEVYTELERFMHWLAVQNADPNNIMLSEEDIVGELQIEFMKGIQHYGDKPHNELLALLKTMMDNRVRELKYRYYLTHRKAEAGMESLDTPAEDDDSEEDGLGEICSDTPGSEELLLSLERVQITREQLQPVDAEVLDAVLVGNARLEQIVKLSALRAQQTFANPTIHIQPWHLAEALFLSGEAIQSAYRNIRAAYMEACYE